MTRQEAIEHLTVSLTSAIEEWTNRNCESAPWESLECYVGEDSNRLMAKAAIAVLEAQSDVQAYLRADGQLAQS